MAMNPCWTVRKRIMRQTRTPRIMIVITVFVFSYAGLFSFLGFSEDSTSDSVNLFDLEGRSVHRKLLEITTQEPDVMTTTQKKVIAPPEFFSKEEKKKGAISLYILGIIYMFIALAIVCDEFFVPALEVITIKLKISEDVAGATFMAAGGSAPELFTSIFGTFISESNVGIGTIVGSAVFNILFVIGMCAIFSEGVLLLTWWPLFRDVTFYSISLICLILFYRGDEIEWWEALMLLCCYVCYVIFMKFNASIENFVKSKIMRKRVKDEKTGNTNIVAIDAEQTPEADAKHDDQGSNQNLPNLATANDDATLHTDRSSYERQQAFMRRRNSSIPILKGSSLFRHGVLQLMIHTIDPLGEAKVQDKALKLHAIAHLNVSDMENGKEKGQATGNGQALPISNGVSNGQTTNKSQNHMAPPTKTLTEAGVAEEEESNSIGRPGTADSKKSAAAVTTKEVVMSSTLSVDREEVTSSQGQLQGGSSEDDLGSDVDMNDLEPLDISWPKTWKKRVTYIIVAPIIFSLYLTLPDVRREDRRKYYPWTFVGSILWIAIFAYLMNWWAQVVGDTAGINDEIMGITFLAAGTSIPDLITSVIVAKKGFGDMAVSSSVGSNIFDVTVGLPLPWILYCWIFGKTYTVDSTGLFCSILLLFLMLLLVIIMIAAFRWRMNKKMGVGLLLGYCVFITISLLILFDVFTCPV